jgi:hypothetical protein
VVGVFGRNGSSRRRPFLGCRPKADLAVTRNNVKMTPEQTLATSASSLEFILLERVMKMHACATSGVALRYLCGNRVADLEFYDDLEDTEDR